MKIHLLLMDFFYCQLPFKWIHKVYSQQAQDICLPKTTTATRVVKLVAEAVYMPVKYRPTSHQILLISSSCA